MKIRNSSDLTSVKRGNTKLISSSENKLRKHKNTFSSKKNIDVSGKNSKRMQNSLTEVLDTNSKLYQVRVSKDSQKFPEEIKKSVNDNLFKQQFPIQKDKYLQKTAAERQLINLLFGGKVNSQKRGEKYLYKGSRQRASNTFSDHFNTRLGSYTVTGPFPIDTFQRNRDKILKTRKGPEKSTEKQPEDMGSKKKQSEGSIQSGDRSKSEKFKLKVVEDNKILKVIDMDYFLMREQDAHLAASRLIEDRKKSSTVDKDNLLKDSFYDSDSSDEIKLDLQPTYTETFDVLLHDKKPEEHVLTKSRHSISHESEPAKSKSKKRDEKKLKVVKEKDPLINYFMNTNKERIEEDAISKTSEDSFKNWMNNYQERRKVGKSFFQRPESPARLSKSSSQISFKIDSSRSSIYSAASLMSTNREKFKNPEVHDHISYILSVVPPINYEGFPLKKWRLRSASLTSFRRQMGRYLKLIKGIKKSKLLHNVEEVPKAQSEGDLSTLKAIPTSDSFKRIVKRPSSVYNSPADRSSIEIEWRKSQWKALTEKRNAAQAKIDELMEQVEIRDIKLKKPKRNFLKEALTNEWLPRKPQKDTIEMKIPKTKYPTKLEVMPLPSELSHLKPLVIRRYLLNKSKDEVELDKDKKEFSGTRSRFGLEKRESDTPLIREMEVKTKKIKQLSNYLSLKKRGKRSVYGCGCHCESSVNP